MDRCSTPAMMVRLARSIRGSSRCAVTIATFMEVLDTSIANVALRYIAGGLSAAESDSEWIITSYLAANASVLLLSGWLSSYFGRRNYYLASLLIFTVSSAACGLRDQPARADLLPDPPGARRRRASAGHAGGAGRHLPPGEAGRGADPLRHLRPDRAGARADARRIHRRQLLVGVDLLHQHPDRACSPSASTTGCCEDPDYLKAERGELRSKPLQLRLHRPRPDRAGRWPAWRSS